MTKTIKPDDFAVGNYPAGANAWNGQPRQIVSSTAEKASGLTPNTPVGAPRLNAFHAEHYAAQTVQAISAVQSWRPCATPGSSAKRLPFLVAPVNPARKQRYLVSLGYDNGTLDVAFARSFGGGAFEDTLQTPANAGATCASRGAQGEFIWATTTALVYRASQLGGSLTSSNFAGNTPCAVHYAEFCARYLTATQTGQFYWASTFATDFLASDPGVSSIAAAALGSPGGEFADDGAAHIVFCGKCVISGVNVYRILHSGDNGATWTVAYTFGAGVTGVSVVWHAAAGQFVALASDGNMYVSSDGSSFAIWRATSITAANGASRRHNTMAVQGNCLVKAYSPSVNGFIDSGIVATFDVGAKWYAHSMADANGFGASLGSDGYGPIQGVYGLLGANGRFYATDRNQVFVSGLVSSEDHDYT